MRMNEENKKFTLMGMIIGGIIAIGSAIFAGWYVKKHSCDFLNTIDIGKPYDYDVEPADEDEDGEEVVVEG